MTPILSAFNCDGGKTIDELIKLSIDTGRPAVLEPKYDGFRLICHIKDGSVDMWTRSLKSQNGKLPHIEEELLATFPPGTVVDGEIMALRKNSDGTVSNRFEDVQSIMLSKPDLAVLKGKVTKLDYVLFDLTYDSTVDIRMDTLDARTRRLESYLEENPNRKHVAITPRFELDNYYHDTLVKMGFEGSIVKFLDTAYQSGKRGRGWYKLKNQPEVDCVVIGYLDGNGKFSGKVGAIVFGQPLADCPAAIKQNLKITDKFSVDGVDYVKRGQCSGMNDRERDEVSHNRTSYLGTVITVKHMGLMHGDSPKMRHPQFDRFRPDKPAHEVIWHNA